jgi:hypothetical protein
MFDFNDHFTHEQAGAASRGFEVFYPIKGLYAVDGSCRVAVGFAPTGAEPGLCETLAPVQPGEAAPGCTLTLAVCQSQGYCGFNPAKCECEVCG